MDLLVLNASELEANETLNQVTKYFNISLSNLTHQSEETQMKLFDLYEAYRTREREQLMAYKFVAYVVGTLIILSNITVVISSGLILRKGQQPKSTYLLLGNVSLADTIIGISVIFGATVDENINSNSMCIFQIGMLVCPAMVSIFSVGLIAIDRYIYILHGLYYQRWFNTTKVRIGILCIWMIGATLGFMPATGWISKERKISRCVYVTLFPPTLILLNSILSLVPIIVVTVLYTIILVKALKNVKNIKKAEQPVDNKIIIDSNEPKLRINRGNVKKVTGTNSVKFPSKNNKTILCRSASFCVYYVNKNITPHQTIHNSIKSKSINDLNESDISIGIGKIENTKKSNEKSHYESEFSINTVYTNCSNNSIDNIESPKVARRFAKSCKKRDSTKPKEPNKWRAITVVMLTSGSFILTWIPFFVTVLFFVFCEDKVTNPKCLHMRFLLGGPLAALAFFNSILNPLIYAWWHRGFQRSVKAYFRKFYWKYICNNKENKIRCDSQKY